MSQRDLAKLAGVHHAQVSRWKSGTHRPDYESMARLGAALRSEHPELGDLTAGLLAATGRGAPAPTAEPGSTGESDGDATVAILRGALSAGEQFILDSDLPPEFAAELVKAWREHGIDELIRLYAERQRRARNG